ncbi:Crp/Fnr family transcriptional regulator [Pedobacter sp. MC2016-15]|uniref:Crp/Fnr family transcriptional regulator n=1 Tax=Pedobacter sp. MC2016-15 TaxID=2994473 RepID=UPI0022460225|nr:Crp/Fnr family transcriptional regulator [Pedobacter sp. MC2016-15]MCX2480594.1 Crp/Fnr family transcriptional regulator [Pedobacter sp. MC2016-15]
MNFKEIVQHIAAVPEASFKALEKFTTQVTLPKGHLLFKAGQINNNIYMISSGISRAYVDLESTELTFAFWGPGKVLLSIQSYVAGTAGYETIELLEDCVLYQFKKADLEELYAKDIHLANWGRKLADQSFVDTERQLIAKQFKTTAERYDDFQRDYPELMNRVKLKHIASYLGMTQVTLSRIRAKK